jgi:hypothetical protein
MGAEGEPERDSNSRAAGPSSQTAGGSGPQQPSQKRSCQSSTRQEDQPATKDRVPAAFKYVQIKREGESASVPIEPSQHLSFSSGIGYSTAGQYWSCHAPRGFSPSLCGPDLFVCDGGTSVVCRGRGMPCQGALLVGAASGRTQLSALAGGNTSAAQLSRNGSSSTCAAPPCYFAAGSRQWFRLTSLRQSRLDGFLAFVAANHFDDGHVNALAKPLDFFHPPLRPAPSRSAPVTASAAGPGAGAAKDSLRQLPSPSRCGALLRWPTATVVPAARSSGGQSVPMDYRTYEKYEQEKQSCCSSVDILVDFRDTSNATITLFGADLTLFPSTGDATGNAVARSGVGGYTFKTYCTPLVAGIDLNAAGGGGYLAFLTHTKLSGFGSLKVEITPPNRVAEIDLSRVLEKKPAQQ